MTVRIGITNQQGAIAKTTNTIKRVRSPIVASSPPSMLITGLPHHRLGFEDLCTSDPPTFYDAFANPNDYAVHDLAVTHDEFDVLPESIDTLWVK